jgi:hypothetical protein
VNPGLIAQALLLAAALTACTPRNERFTYLIAPAVSDEQLATLRARDARMRVFMSADGAQRFLTSPTPVDQLGARVSTLRNHQSVDGTAAGEVVIGLIEAVVDGLLR